MSRIARAQCAQSFLLCDIGEMCVALRILPLTVHHQVGRQPLAVLRVLRPRHNRTRFGATLREQRVLPRL